MENPKRTLSPARAKQLGAIGFAFFFIKGMAWLIAPAIFLWLQAPGL